MPQVVLTRRQVQLLCDVVEDHLGAKPPDDPEVEALVVLLNYALKVPRFTVEVVDGEADGAEPHEPPVPRNEARSREDG